MEKKVETPKHANVETTRWSLLVSKLSNCCHRFYYLGFYSHVLQVLPVQYTMQCIVHVLLFSNSMRFFWCIHDGKCIDMYDYVSRELCLYTVYFLYIFPGSPRPNKELFVG